MRLRLGTLAGFLGLVAVSPGAEATLITFTDKTTFLSTTGASTATGALPDVGPVPPGYAVGSVRFTTLSGQFFIGTGGLTPGIVTDWSASLPGADIAISGVEDFRADLAAPVYSLGFDFFEPDKFSTSYPVTDDCFAPCFDSTFRVALFSGGVPLAGGSFTYDAPDATPYFVGVWSDVPFDRAEITDLTATIDDEYWGQFYTGTTAPTPEPSGLLVVAAGLIATGLHRRRRQ